MIVGSLTIDLAVSDAQSLKDKRRVIHGLKQRLRDRFNVSVSEVDFLDAPRRCRLCVAMVTRESRPMHSQFDKIMDLVRRTRGASVLEYSRDLY